MERVLENKEKRREGREDKDNHTQQGRTFGLFYFLNFRGLVFKPG